MKIVKIRTKICEIISRMLDNPDEYEIYPTGRCYDELEEFIQRLLDDQKKAIPDPRYYLNIREEIEKRIKKKIEKVGMGERWAMQAFHNGYSQAKIDILKKLNK